METAEQLAQRIADGHAFEIHVERKREFEKPSHGTPVPIASRQEFKDHLVRVLESTETLCCTVFSELSPNRPADIFYHPATNTLIVVPENLKAEPTAYRPDDNFLSFLEKVEESTDLGYGVEIKESIYELRPELAAEREATRIRAADQELRQTVERRFEQERDALLSQHALKGEQSIDPELAKSRLAQELRALSARKEEDFQRYRRERENALRLQKEHRQRELEQQRLREGPELGPDRDR